MNIINQLISLLKNASILVWLVAKLGILVHFLIFFYLYNCSKVCSQCFFF